MAAILLAAVFFNSCGGTEKTEGVVAEITAAQMQGRSAARSIVNRHWSDTIRLMQALKEARSPKLRYDTTGHPECGAAFDSAYISTLRTVNPKLEELARQN